MRSLQWKLTYSYFLITVVIAAAAVFLPEIYVDAKQHSLSKLRVWIGSTLVRDLETILGTDDLNAERDSLVEILAKIDRSPLADSVSPPAVQIESLSIVDPSRVELATWPADIALLGPLPNHAQDDIDDALSGHDTIGSEVSGRDLIVVGSIYAPSERRIVGAILVTARWRPTLPAITRSAIRIATRPSALLFAAALVIGGTAFGWFVSRPIGRRVRRMSAVADTWGSGDLSASVESAEHDELGKLGDDLDAMAAHLRDLMAERSNLAAEQERSSLARDLHDTVKQHLFAANMQLSTVSKLMQSDPESAEAALRQASELYRKATEDLSAILVGDADLTTGKGGYAAAIERLVADWSKRTRIPSRTSTSNCELSATAQVELHRILQEALANIERHANASRVVVSLLQSQSSVELTVEDDGVGFDPSSCRPGLGLRSMRARVAKLGGVLAVERPIENRGTVVRVVVEHTGATANCSNEEAESNSAPSVSHG